MRNLLRERTGGRPDCDWQRYLARFWQRYVAARDAGPVR